MLSDIPVLIPNVSLSLPKSPALRLGSPRGNAPNSGRLPAWGAKHPKRNALVLPPLVGHLSHERYRRWPSALLYATVHVYTMRNEQRAPDAAQPVAVFSPARSSAGPALILPAGKREKLIPGSARANGKYISACVGNAEEMFWGELGFALVLSGELGGSHPVQGAAGLLRGAE